MKNIIVLWCLIFQIIHCYGQQIKNKPLSVGDYLPPLPLGRVMNNKGDLSFSYKGDTAFADLRGKIVIFDFWTSYCATCIAGFDHLSKLQNEFGDKIQIFLVNGSEDEIRIRNWLTKQNMKSTSGNIVPDNLPMIVGANKLLELFPLRREIGYHVWLGKDGKVLLRGISQNTHSKKILQALSGQKLTFVKDNARAYDGQHPFFFSQSSSGLPVLSSGFGYFDDERATAYGVGIQNFIDSISRTRRSTFLNYDILALYQKALDGDRWLKNRIIFGDPIVLEVKDTFLITRNAKINRQEITDENFLNSFCYEQIVPTAFPIVEAKKLMLKDLNVFFKYKIGIVGYWEQRNISCVKLTFNGNIKKIESKSRRKNIRYTYNADRTRTIHYENYPLNVVFKDYFAAFQDYARIDIKQVIIDSVKNSDVVDLELPDPYDVKDYNHLCRIMADLGFQMEPDFLTIPVFVLRQFSL